jgi:hypothetical protein
LSPCQGRRSRKCAALWTPQCRWSCVQIDVEALSRPELDDRVVGTHAVAVVAFEAVATGHTAARLEERGLLVESTDHLLEGGHPPDRLQSPPPSRRGSTTSAAGRRRAGSRWRCTRGHRRAEAPIATDIAANSESTLMYSHGASWPDFTNSLSASTMWVCGEIGYAQMTSGRHSATVSATAREPSICLSLDPRRRSA